MDTRTIGTLTVSEVGLGCNNFGMLIERKESDAVVGAALDAGITLFDTADMYGNTKSEEYLGQALGARRDEIVLATKFGGPFEGHSGGATPAYLRTSLEDSLRRLGTDRIDLYQLHYPDPKTPIAETLGSAGRPGGRGQGTRDRLLEFRRRHARGGGGRGAQTAHRRFVSVQNEYNLLHRDPEDGVLAFCDRTHTAFLPYFPLASGLLTGKYRSSAAPEGTRLAAWGSFAKDQLSDERLATVAALDALARSEGHTVLDLAFAWLLARPSVASVIAGATKPEQVAANVAAGQWKPSAELLAQVDAIAPR